MAPRLYHISENPNLTVMTPRIPNNRLVREGYENGTIGRVCFAPNIDYAIAAAPRGKAGELLYVYIPTSVDKSAIYRPTPQEVPDVTYTHEIWYLKPVTVKKVGVILVGDAYLEQRFLGPGSYKKHFILRFQKFKRFKNLPTDEERREYWKENPVYYEKFVAEEKRKQRNSVIAKVAKRALAASAGVGLFMLVGNKLKTIAKDKLKQDSLTSKSPVQVKCCDSVDLHIVTINKTISTEIPNGARCRYDIKFGNEKVGLLVTEKIADGKERIKKFEIIPGYKHTGIKAHILKNYFN